MSLYDYFVNQPRYPSTQGIGMSIHAHPMISCLSVYSVPPNLCILESVKCGGFVLAVAIDPNPKTVIATFNNIFHFSHVKVPLVVH
jgi:hypothetical protein